MARVRAGIASGLLALHLTGCFQYVPVSSSAMPSGSEVTVGVTDRGRVALAPTLGPGARRVTGQVLESTDSTLVLSVRLVEYIEEGGHWPLSVERVVIERDHITEVRERRLSRARSWTLAGILIAGALAATQIAITGFGSDDGGGDRPGGGNTGSQ